MVAKPAQKVPSKFSLHANLMIKSAKINDQMMNWATLDFQTPQEETSGLNDESNADAHEGDFTGKWGFHSESS